VFARQYPPDLAVLRVTDARNLPCQEWQPLNNFDAMLKTQSSGRLFSSERTGSVSPLDVTFSRFDAERVYVEPAQANRQIAQTMSGSGLFVNGALAGILLQTEPGGLGMVYQLDDVMRITQPYFDIATTSKVNSGMDITAATTLLDRAVQARDGSSQGQNDAVATLLARGHDFSNVNWSGVSLKGAALSGGRFSGLVMHVGDLSGANLRGANLEKAGLRFANLEGARLDGAALQGVYAPFVSAQGAELTDAKLNGANFYGSDFRKANFTKATLAGTARRQLHGRRSHGRVSDGCPSGWRRL
jgi:hypothetical protein